MNTKDNISKFDPKFYVGTFLEYSNPSKAYRVYNKRILVVEKSMHVTFDESNPSSIEKNVVNDDVDEVFTTKKMVFTDFRIMSEIIFTDTC